MISVSIIDDSAKLRQSIATFVNNSPGFRCVSTYSNGDEAILRLPADNPDVVLMTDINMPGMSTGNRMRQTIYRNAVAPLEECKSSC